jgi:predicted MFS family arabinose efflux permease
VTPAARFTEILREPGMARLLLPALVARVPDSIAATGLVILGRSATGSYEGGGVAAAAFGIGTAVSAPLAGRAVDRLGQRWVLRCLAACFAATLTVLAVSATWLGVAGLAVLAGVAGLTRPPIEAGLRALWPRLVPAGRLDAAYTLDSTLQELIWIGGPLLLAALLLVGSPRVPLLACAVLSLAGTIGYTASRRVAGQPQPPGQAGASPLRSARLAVLLAASAGYGLAAGMLNVSLVAFAGRHGGVAWTGALVAIWGAGSLAGGLIYGSRTWRAPVERRALGCLALFSGVLMVLAVTPNLAVLALLMIPLGLPLSPWLGSLSAAVQRAVPRDTATEAFTVNFAVVTLGIAAGNALGGIISQHAGPGAAFLVAGAAGLAGVLAGVLGRGRLAGAPDIHAGFTRSPGPGLPG